jgi:hypothetical protein
MAVIAAAVANTIETAVHFIAPISGPVPDTNQIMAAIPETNVNHTRQWLAQVIRAAIEAGRKAGYHEAQADFVLQMMLTEGGRDVLRRLAGIADNGEEPGNSKKV